MRPRTPPKVKDMSIQQLVDEMVEDITIGVDGSGIRAGIIGEVGVSPQFTDQEMKCLRAAARASSQTRVPLTIHQPSFLCEANRVLDAVLEEGGDPAHTIVGHMCASGRYVDYQTSVLARGAWIQYDLIGSDLYYPHIQAQPAHRRRKRASSCAPDRSRFYQPVVAFAGYLYQNLLAALRRPGLWAYFAFIRPAP